MPITVQRVEPHVYCAEFIGIVTLEEILGGRLEALATDHDELPYIIILDATRLTKIPFDITGLRNIDLVYTAQAVYVVEPPPSVSVMCRILNRLTDKQYIEVETYDDALTKARERLNTPAD